MPSMFPGMYPSPDDLNRRPAAAGGGDDDTWPGALRWGYYLAVAAAVVMVLAGLVTLTDDYAGGPDASRETVEAFRRNLRFIGAFDIIAGLVIAALAAQLKAGGRASRRMLAVVIGLAVFFNIAAFALQVGGLGMLVIVILLAVAALLMFRPESNRYIAQMSGRGN